MAVLKRNNAAGLIRRDKVLAEIANFAIASESPGTKDFWGTKVSEMQSSLAVSNGKFTGTLKWLSEGQLVTDWGAGNFMAIKFTLPANAVSCRVGLQPSVSSGLVALDEDKNAVIKVTDKNKQKFVASVTMPDGTAELFYDLSSLTLEEATAEEEEPPVDLPNA